jgi:hypothetical protein
MFTVRIVVVMVVTTMVVVIGMAMGSLLTLLTIFGIALHYKWEIVMD